MSLQNPVFITLKFIMKNTSFLPSHVEKNRVLSFYKFLPGISGHQMCGGFTPHSPSNSLQCKPSVL